MKNIKMLCLVVILIFYIISLAFTVYFFIYISFLCFDILTCSLYAKLLIVVYLRFLEFYLIFFTWLEDDIYCRN